MEKPGTPLAQRWYEDIDRLLLDPARMFVMGVLVNCPDYFRFGNLCENSGVTKTVLARHVRRLRLAGYVETRRGACNELWIRTTSLGQQRFELHVKAAQETITRARDVGNSARS
ncbi:helix-turn-helix transcriptional regulator [Haloechinothrix salitolerans]|uniref:Transcriptional regulator n=1 Tax=Haloechinothrix salitolerans TaxID=926830 RepID=A0ABW2C362_9PSEU